MICLQKCPVEAITGGKKQVHVIDQNKCIKCGTCFDACPPRFGAVKRSPVSLSPPAYPETEETVF
jgi:F420-non-reducing hydrogenase iron-sulfur subunit